MMVHPSSRRHARRVSRAGQAALHVPRAAAHAARTRSTGSTRSTASFSSSTASRAAPAASGHRARSRHRHGGACPQYHPERRRRTSTCGRDARGDARRVVRVKACAAGARRPPLPARSGGGGVYAVADEVNPVWSTPTGGADAVGVPESGAPTNRNAAPPTSETSPDRPTLQPNVPSPRGPRRDPHRAFEEATTQPPHRGMMEGSRLALTGYDCLPTRPRADAWKCSR